MFKGLRLLIGLGIVALFLWLQYRRGAPGRLRGMLSRSPATAAVRVARMDSAALAADARLGTSLQAFDPARLGDHVLEVARVIDGDTYALTLPGSTHVRVRLIGVDTPEKDPSEKLREKARRARVSEAQVQRWGERAFAAGRRLAAGRRVRLEYDHAYAAQDYRGRYGGLLAYVWVLASDGQPVYLLNEALLRQGYGHAVEAPRYGGRFRMAELAARRRADGLFERGPARRKSMNELEHGRKNGARPKLPTGRPKGRRRLSQR